MATTTEVQNYFAIPGLKTGGRIDYSILASTRRNECFKVIEDVLLEAFPKASKRMFHYQCTTSRKPSGVKEIDGLVRQLFCYLCRECYFTSHTKTSLKGIGTYIYPAYDHTSVLHSVITIKNRLFIKEIKAVTIESLRYEIDIKLNRIWQEVASSEYYRKKIKAVY